MRHPGKVTQFDEARGETVVLFELSQGLVESRQILFGLGGHKVVELDALPVAAALCRGSGPSALNEDAAHGLGGHSEKVTAAVPAIGLRSVYQPKVGFMDERRSLQRLPGLFVRHSCRGKASQLAINEGQQLVGRTSIPGLDPREHPGDITHPSDVTAWGRPLELPSAFGQR